MYEVGKKIVNDTFTWQSFHSVMTKVFLKGKIQAHKNLLMMLLNNSNVQMMIIIYKYILLTEETFISTMFSIYAQLITLYLTRPETLYLVNAAYLTCCHNNNSTSFSYSHSFI